MIVTAHQPNYLPSLSIIEKIRASDAVVWLDEVQFTHNGWTNRNRLPDGSWLTVPIERDTDMAAMNRVRISEHDDWRKRHCKSLRQAWGEVTSPFCEEILRPYRLLVGLNLACLRLLLEGSETAWHFQSHLDGGHALQFVSEQQEELRPISERLAMMVEELKGDVYLSGPSGRNYLDETPFAERGIEVKYWHWDGSQACAVSAMRIRAAYQPAA